MTKLSVNVNKLATLRNSRGGNNPDVLKTSLDIIRFGSEGITVHPRPDARHIRHSDVFQLKAAISVELNIEGYPDEHFLQMVDQSLPAQVTLVPDPPDAITSNAGWLIRPNSELLKTVTDRIHKTGARVSVFVDPWTMEVEDYELLKAIGVDRVELYTEKFAHTFGKAGGVEILAKYKEAAERARKAGLGVNAGHDLSLENLTGLIKEIPWIDEVSIGHALICDALYLGLEETIRRYLACIREGIRLSKNS